MAKHLRFRYSIPVAVFVIVAGVLLFLSGRSVWLFVIGVELIAIHVCVEFLTERMPASLRKQSQANCYRLDGTLSPRRSSRERKAVRKIRSDLWAAFLIVASIGTSGVFVVDTQVFPLPLVAVVASALHDDPADFKGALRQRNVDDKFFHWSRSRSTGSNAAINQQMRRLWITTPVVLGLVVACLVACIALLRYAYFRTLGEFHCSVSRRATEYLNLDMGRLQDREAGFRHTNA